MFFIILSCHHGRLLPIKEFTVKAGDDYLFYCCVVNKGRGKYCNPPLKCPHLQLELSHIN
jgi:hypothetical protein